MKWLIHGFIVNNNFTKINLINKRWYLNWDSQRNVAQGVGWFMHYDIKVVFGGEQNWEQETKLLENGHLKIWIGNG